MGNSNNKSSTLRKSQSVPDTQRLAPDAPVFDKQKSVSQMRLNQTQDKPAKPGKAGKKQKQQQQLEELPQLAPQEATFLPEFPLRGDLEDLEYDILEVIARGAFGNVIKIQKEDEKKFYAVKVLDKAQIMEEGAIRQCKDEATIQSMAGEHPFVVKAHEYWQSRRSLYIVLDYVPHGDMFTLWTFHGAFPEDLVQLYIAEMAMVIDYLHNASVIYRDIKMENILFNSKGHIQLTDFGLAKWLQGGDQTRTVCGTLQYMAPEVLSVYPYSHSADWWSLGILMYAMLAGKYPVDGADTHTRMAQRVFECDFLLPSHISDAAQDVINRVLTKSPHKRLCDVNSLQDLDFFQGIFFSDLIEQKLSPLDVVPEDFFPMTGQSWAPQLLTDEEQGHFDQFDDSNTTLTDEPGYPHYPHYNVKPPAVHHHPDPVHRLEPVQPQNQQLPQMYDKQHQPQSQQQHQPHQQTQFQQQPYQLKQAQLQQLPEPQLHQQHPHGQNYNTQPMQLSQDYKKPASGFRGASHDPVMNKHNPSARDDRLLEQSSFDNINLQAGSSGGLQRGISQPSYDGRSNVLSQNMNDVNNERIDGSNDITSNSNTNQNRRSFGSSSGNHSSLNNPVSASTVTSGNSMNINGAAGNMNRRSVGPEYKPVEAPPTVVLKTPASQNSSQLRFNQPSPFGYNSQITMGNPTSSGYVLQNHSANNQTIELNSLVQKSEHQTQFYNTQINSQAARLSLSSVDREYKTLDPPPTVSLPSAQIKFSQNPSVPLSKELQHLPPPITNSFPVNYSSNSTSLSYPNSDIQRLEQAVVTSNNLPQITNVQQRPNIPAKPIPPQKPPVMPKPSVPVKPIPAPRQSLRYKPQNKPQLNTESRGSLTFNQGPGISNFNQEYPQTSGASQSQNLSLHSQNTNSVNSQQSWRNTPQQQPLTSATSDLNRNRSSSMSNILTSSDHTEPETSTKSPEIDSHNFQWKLPAGTRPSFV